jgi:hypothetical protein
MAILKAPVSQERWWTAKLIAARRRITDTPAWTPLVTLARALGCESWSTSPFAPHPWLSWEGSNVEVEEPANMRLHQRIPGQKGQVMVLSVLAMIVTMGFASLTLDMGMFFEERRITQNAVDAAALAGAQVLPNDGAQAEDLAREWALKNESGLEFESLDISFRCIVGDRDNNGQPDAGDIPVVCDPGAASFTCRNERCASLCDVNSSTNRCNAIVVTASKDVPFRFAPVLAILDGSDRCIYDDCSTGALMAVACRGACGAAPSSPLDVVMVFDETGTMKSGCQGTEAVSGFAANCPIAQARQAAHTLADNLFPTNAFPTTQIGLVPFRGCHGDQRHNPIAGEAAGRGCILFSEIKGLTGPAGKSGLESAIDGMHAEGGFPGTNLCTGLDQASNVLFGSGSQSGAKKVVIVITDGDNRYSDGAGGGSPNRGNPVPAVLPTAAWPAGQGGSHTCQPTLVPGDNTGYGADYDAAINNMDVRTRDRADTLRNAGAEIFVVRFADPPGDSSASTTCSSSLVGQGTARQGQNDTWDRNVSRCIATSTQGTNDHYYYAPTPAELPDIFADISYQILSGSKLVSLP